MEEIITGQKIHPNKEESEFLHIAYNRFYSLYTDMLQDEFWSNSKELRLFKIKELFSTYFELLKYPPLQWIIEKEKRPFFADVGKDLFRFIRNILLHFPFFDSWMEIRFNRSLINWSQKKQFIDRFLKQHEGQDPIKYRFWEAEKKKMTYISVNFPKNYTKNEGIFLKDILSEKDGVKFSVIFMSKILNTQIEEER